MAGTRCALARHRLLRDADHGRGVGLGHIWMEHRGLSASECNAGKIIVAYAWTRGRAGVWTRAVRGQRAPGAIPTAT